MISNEESIERLNTMVSNINLRMREMNKRIERLEDMDARELRYKFMKLSENYSDWYVFREILLYMNQEQLQQFWDEFEKNHPNII